MFVLFLFETSFVEKLRRGFREMLSQVMLLALGAAHYLEHQGGM